MRAASPYKRWRSSWRSPGSRARSVHACQGLRPRRVAWALAIARPCVLPSVNRTTSAPGSNFFRGSMAGLHVPLSTLHVAPRGTPRMTRGQCGSLCLHCKGLAPSTPCRSPGAPDPNLTHRGCGRFLGRCKSIESSQRLDDDSSEGAAMGPPQRAHRHRVANGCLVAARSAGWMALVDLKLPLVNSDRDTHTCPSPDAPHRSSALALILLRCARFF